MSLKHIILDIETLATDAEAAVLSVACVPFVLEVHTYFDELVKSGFFVKFNIEEQIKIHKRSIEKSTLEWWKTQNKEVFNSMVKPSKEDVSIKEGLTNLNKFIKSIDGFEYQRSYVWSRGNNFDFPILKSLYRDADISPAYNDWRARDVRTAIDIMAGTDNGQYNLRFGESKFLVHNPLHDAAMDAARINELFYIAMLDNDVPF